MRLTQHEVTLLKENYSIDEFGKFENQGTLIDLLNNIHKRGLFDDREELWVMKDVRNMLVHGYIEDVLVDVFDEVMIYADKLIENTLKYIDSKIK